jgi:hypothetical protein
VIQVSLWAAEHPPARWSRPATMIFLTALPSARIAVAPLLAAPPAGWVCDDGCQFCRLPETD